MNQIAKTNEAENFTAKIKQNNESEPNLDVNLEELYNDSEAFKRSHIKIIMLAQKVDNLIKSNLYEPSQEKPKVSQKVAIASAVADCKQN